MTRTIKTIEKEKYTERELEDLANDVYGNDDVSVLGIPMQSLYILKMLDEPAYSELLEGLQEYVDWYICPVCGEEHEDESDAEDCCPEDSDTESNN